MGGGLIEQLDDHPPGTGSDNSAEPLYHHIYISPGSKLAAVVGSGGFVRVNSHHRQGVREAQKSPRLLASAYSLDDGLIEALESPAHRWVIAVQFNPERRMEVPPHFDRLFQSLVERASERVSLKTRANSIWNCMKEKSKNGTICPTRRTQRPNRHEDSRFPVCFYVGKADYGLLKRETETHPPFS